MRRRAILASTLLSTLSLGTLAEAGTLAWWRFEDQSPGTKLDATLGTREQPFITTKSSVSNDLLRSFNTNPHKHPSDTSGTFKTPRDLPNQVGGEQNERCVRFVGNQDFYSTGQKDETPAIDSADFRAFTVEGLFKLDATSAQISDRYQTVLGKDGRPVESLPFQPFVVVVAGRDDQFMSRDCLSVNLIDRAGKYRCAASRVPLRTDTWYAFAAVCDATSLKLYLNRFDGRGYVLEAETDLEGGLIESTGTWTVGRGMFESQPNSWLQGYADEIRISDEALPSDRWLAANLRTLPPRDAEPAPKIEQPTLCVTDLADPEVLLHNGNYYLYGTGDSRGFDVWRSSDLKTWAKVSRAIEAGEGVWGDGAFWAPDIVERHGKFYLFYSTSGVLPVDGGRRSVRMCVAVADKPEGPFREVVARMPLIGRAVIDPDVFIDTDGTPYLYFVADISENNGSGQIYVVKLSDDLLSAVGEPVACISPSQLWEGTVWNEAPLVLKHGEQYVLMYSGSFWGSHDYAVGYATAPTPMGPWNKCDENPILRRHAGLVGTAHNAVAPSPDGKSLLMFFHAHRGERDARRDTYFTPMHIEATPGNQRSLQITFQSAPPEAAEPLSP